MSESDLMTPDEANRVFKDFLACQQKIAFCRLGTSTDDVPQSVALNPAYSSPWLRDQKFSSLYEILKPFTMVQSPCLYEAWSLLGQMGDFGGDVIEVGSWR